jgi:cysteine synthase B
MNELGGFAAGTSGDIALIDQNHFETRVGGCDGAPQALNSGTHHGDIVLLHGDNYQLYLNYKKPAVQPKICNLSMSNSIDSTLTQKMFGEDILNRVGKTPLLRIKNIVKNISPKVQILGKAEWYNPSGSVKDRAAFRMISEAEKSGKLSKDKIILDATSGNTGISYALIGAAKGYKVKLAIPSNCSIERKQVLSAYGVELVFTSPHEGSDGAIRKAREIYEKEPQKYFYPDQYNNENNWKAHLETTGPEIWEQTQGQVTHFIAGLGTTGTFVGTTRFLKSKNPKIQCLSMQPDCPLHGLEGLKFLQTSIVPGIYDPKLADKEMFVATEDAYAMVKELAKQEGLLVGISAGANLVAAFKLAQELKEGVIVTILCDSADKYLTDSFWEHPSKIMNPLHFES